MMQYFDCRDKKSEIFTGYDSSMIKEEYKDYFFLGIDFSSSILFNYVSSFLDKIGISYETTDLVNLLADQGRFSPEAEITFIISKEDYNLFTMLAVGGDYFSSGVLLTYKGWE